MNLLFLLSILISCRSETSYDKLISYFEDQHQYSLDQNIRAIAVISEKGGCMSCNKSFSDFISEKINDPSVLFLVCSSGRMLDISFYLDKESSKNIFFDQHDQFAATKIIEKSGIIFIKEHTIDTIVEISLESKEASFAFIDSKLD